VQLRRLPKGAFHAQRAQFDVGDRELLRAQHGQLIVLHQQVLQFLLHNLRAHGLGACRQRTHLAEAEPRQGQFLLQHRRVFFRQANVVQLHFVVFDLLRLPFRGSQ
jgi:hypothetical protein